MSVQHPGDEDLKAIAEGSVEHSSVVRISKTGRKLVCFQQPGRQEKRTVSQRARYQGVQTLECVGSRMNHT